MSNVINHILTTPVTLGGVYQSPLTITAAGGIEPVARGAAALYAPSGLGTVHIRNEGTIVGGAGAYGGGQAGGVGVDLATNAIVNNTGFIYGGAGGGGAYYGGKGGDGLILAAGGTVANGGTIEGGIGGSADANFPASGQGAAGGTGIYL